MPQASDQDPGLASRWLAAQGQVLASGLCLLIAQWGLTMAPASLPWGVEVTALLDMAALFHGPVALPCFLGFCWSFASFIKSFRHIPHMPISGESLELTIQGRHFKLRILTQKPLASEDSGEGQLHGSGAEAALEDGQEVEGEPVADRAGGLRPGP